MKRLLPALLLLAACATAVPPAKMPEWTEVPAPILNAFCSRVRSEGVSRESQISVVKTTQPIVTASSLRSLGESYFKIGDTVMLAEALNAALKPLPLSITQGGSCAWKPIDHLDTRRDHEVLVVELSAPFVNPFVRGESGLFARMSAGGQGSQWYWIPIAERNGQWAIGRVTPLELHEE
ncbi:MAG TPA: hypothetical protein VJ901_12190 [Thermoanaerobaculia bacterium]|nr:hypothetical protein [Thermoanaerobaculia bacterium]